VRSQPRIPPGVLDTQHCTIRTPTLSFIASEVGGEDGEVTCPLSRLIDGRAKAVGFRSHDFLVVGSFHPSCCLVRHCKKKRWLG